MNESKFGLRKRNSELLKLTDGLKDSYSSWKKHKKRNVNVGTFFMLYKDIGDCLSEISGGALKLYVYYGFASKNKTGESWHSVGNVAKSMDVSPRTIDKWNVELEESGLIKRVNAGKKSKTVFLLPLSDYVLRLSSIEQLSKWLSSPDFNEIYGDGIRYFLLVQSSRQDKKDNYIHYHVFLTEKKHGNLNKIHTLFVYVERNSNLGPNINDDSDEKFFRLEKHNDLQSFETDIPTRRWCVDSEIKLSDDEILIDLVLELTHSDIVEESYQVIGWKILNEGSDADE